MIPAVYRANFNYLLRHPWQLALAVLGISVGVAVIVAVDLANDSSRKAFLLSMDAVTGEATHQIIGGRRGIDESLYVELRVRHGFRSIAPVVEGSVAVNENSLQVLGVDLFAEQEMRAFSRRLATGASSQNGPARSFFRDMLTQPGAVMLSETTASALGIGTGERFDLVASGRTHSALLLGTFAEGTTTGLDNLITTDIATAQSWFNRPGRLSRIDVRLADSDVGLQQRLETLLPADVTLLSAAARTQTTAWILRSEGWGELGVLDQAMDYAGRALASSVVDFELLT